MLTLLSNEITHRRHKGDRCKSLLLYAARIFRCNIVKYRYEQNTKRNKNREPYSFKKLTSFRKNLFHSNFLYATWPLSLLIVPLELKNGWMGPNPNAVFEHPTGDIVGSDLSYKFRFDLNIGYRFFAPHVNYGSNLFIPLSRVKYFFTLDKCSYVKITL